MAKKVVKKKTVKKKVAKKRKAKSRKISVPGGAKQPQLTYDEIECIKALLSVNTSKQKVADEVGHSWATIDKISKLNDEEIEGFRDIKRKEFIKKAWEKIEMLLRQVTERKCAFATVNQVTTAMGTIYDKAALASGEATERTELEVMGIEFRPVDKKKNS